MIDSGRPKCGLPASDAALAARRRSAVLFFTAHSAAGAPRFDRLRSPEMRAPCVGRRTRGAAQMGRGGFAARDGAAWRYQRKIVGGHEAHCPT